MNKKQVFAYFATASLLFIGFQNCSQVDFAGGGSQLSKADSGVGSTDTDNGINNNGEFGVGDDEVDGGLVEVTGGCDDESGVITLGGDVIIGHVANCENDGFKICTRLDNTGDNIVTFTQTNPQITTNVNTIEYPIFTTHVTIEDLVFNFETIELVSTSQGRITVKCVPGASVSAEIYGQDQVGNLVCTVDGTITFDVKLVPGLINTGQRIVTVRQVMENGHVTEITVDVDNVVSTHTCSIDQGMPNQNICVDSAGQVTGTCKPGLPIKILVDGVAQESVVCDSGGNFTMNNILIGSSAEEHTVTIEQDNPFTNVSCTDTATVHNIMDL